ncbi:helicase-related protein [Methanobrevibacter sp.]|uniref:helicase-related protein n=1 Tax=Methanobrevibacter sp. TaxID=66852 RepID=UPI00386F72C1
MSELIYEKFGKILSNDVVQKLIGAHDEFKITKHHSLPSKNILIGALLPKSVESDVSIENSKDLNSISVKCLLKDDVSPINVDISFSMFYRVFPSFEEQIEGIKKQGNKKSYSIERIWKRKDVSISNIAVNPLNGDNVELDLSAVIKEIMEDPNVVKFERKIPSGALDSEDNFEEFLDNIRKEKFEFRYAWNLHIKSKVRSFLQDDEDYLLLELFLVNNTIDLSNEDKAINLYDRTIFNPIMSIDLKNNELIPFHYVYTYDDQLKDYYGDLRCLNCHGNYDEGKNIIKTSNYVTFDQEKVSPKSDVDYADISFKTLSSERGFLELDKIYLKMNEFYENSRNNSSSENQIYLKELDEFKDMKERFNDNIQLLRTNSNAAKAFYLMNETFSNNSKYPTWRLFQIVFIVLQIRDIVETDYQRDVCELLHVMTGGGKSEAYFGIVIFAAFWDRLNGKKFGVSALTKFPLRMLSIQQLQRIANVFIHAEEVRREHDVGGEPFSIAYYVGSQGNEFPRHNFRIINQILVKKEKNEFFKGKIIEKCPLCGGDVFLDIDESQNLVIHKCHSCNKVFRLYYSDDEIYRTLPTFIVATVDKLASIASNRRFKNLLGGKLDVCKKGHGFIPRNDKCEVKHAARQFCNESGSIFDVDFDIGPTLIIQDEMHLIREGFGTIDSHFESLIEAMKMEFSEGVNFKNIVMTATVTGAKTQIQHLYHKKTRIFPPTLLNSNGNNFFFETLKEGDKIINQRQIVGLKQNAYSTMLLLVILRYVSEFIKKIEGDLMKFAEDNDFELDELSTVIPYYKNLLTYHNRKQDVHKMSYNILDLVNSYPSTYDLVPNNLTGDDNLDHIKETINNVSSFQDKDENKDKLSLVSATSIVSHGVDIDTWNVMAFEGMPRNTSEYIQALSRVGRKHFGIVFVLYDYMKIRDVSFYQNFSEYHEILDDKVENVPLARWTKLGFKQTFTSVFCASVLNYMSDLLEKPIYTVEEFNKVFNEDMNRRLLINFIKEAYISNSDMLGADFFDEMIEEETIERIDYLADYSGSETSYFPNALKDRSHNKYYKTQFGMRGIQDSLVFSPVNQDLAFRKNIGGK